MNSASKWLGRLDRPLIHLGIVLCHTALMAFAIGVAVTMHKTGFDGYRAAGLHLILFCGPPVLCGVIYRRYSGLMPSSRQTWWMAFLFTLATLVMVAAGIALGYLPSIPGLYPFQYGGLIFGAGTLSILISAIMFRLGASPADLARFKRRKR